MSCTPPAQPWAPLRSRGPGRRPSVHSAIRWTVIVTISAACAAPPPPPRPPSEPPPAVLVVATNGMIETIDGSGARHSFDGPARFSSTVSAAAGVVVVLGPSGQAMVSDDSVSPRAWRPLALPVRPDGALRLAALAPTGAELAIADGDPRAASFDLVIVDIASRAARKIPIARQLNGPPAWLGPATIAVDVIAADGSSGIALIDVRTGVPDPALRGGTTIAASVDGTRLAVDDPATGDVLVGDLATWRAGSTGQLARIGGAQSMGVSSLALSATGIHLAIVRSAERSSTIELSEATDSGWTAVRRVHMVGDGPPSVAWLH